MCNSGFDSEASLVEHYENAHDSGNMEQEESVHDGKEHEPEIDINEIDSDLIPTVIMNDEQEYPVNQCLICGECYETIDDLQLHKSAVHDGKNQSPVHEEENLKCTLCEDFSCAAKYDLEQHIGKVHNTIKGWLCIVCNCTYNRKDNLKSHVDSVHRGKKYKDGLMKQIPDHQKGTVLFCTLCASNFDSEAILVEHYESAHKRYLCTVCKNLYTRRDNLKTHIDKSHSGMSTYKCSLCEDFSCAAKSDLKQHMEDTHNTEKGWLCTMCNCTYNRKDNLKSHVDSVHKGKKKFFCEICNAGFLRSLHLQSHIASVHEGKKGNNIKEEQFAYKEENPVDEEESFVGHEIP